MANLANNSTVKKIAVCVLSALLLPITALAARTSIDWVNPSGTSYFQPNFPSGLDLLIYGTSHYINFNTLSGSSGYGFRDNAGTMEFKNSGGSWSSFGSGAGEANTGGSLGTGLNIFDTKSGVQLLFNTLAAGSNITLSTSTNSNTIVISGTGGSGAYPFTPGTFGSLTTSNTTTAIKDSAGLITSTSSIGNLTAGTITATSTLTIATSTNGCAQGLNGLIFFTGTNCGTGSGGGSDPFSHGTWGGITTSASSTLFQLFAGAVISTSSVGNLTAGTFTATSTLSVTGTATSTFAGAIKNANGDTLAIEPSYIVSTSSTNGAYTDIQSAINALPSTGGRVAVRCGVYTITAPITIAQNNVVIEGQGNCTNIQFNAANASTTFSNSNAGTQLTGILIKNLQINQTGTAGTGTGIDMSGFAISRLENVWIDNVKVGVLSDNVRTDYNSFANMRVGATSTASFGFKFVNSSNFNQITKARILTASTTAGVYIDTVGISCEDCDVETGASYGVYVGSNAHNVNLLNPWLEGNGINLYLSSGVEQVNVQGGSIHSATSTNIYDAGVKGMTVNTRVEFEPTSYYLTNGDNFGIDTNNPLKMFTVGSTTANHQGALRINGVSTANNAPFLSFFRSGTAEWGFGAGGTSAGDFNLDLNPTASSYTDANLQNFSVFTVKGAAGNFIGIGTTSPYAKLSVAGQIVGAFFTGTTTATSTLAGGLQTTAINATAASSTINGLVLTGGLQLPGLVCNGSNTLDTDSSGNVVCGTDDTAAGGGTYPFTPTTAWGSLAQSTTSILAFPQELVSSSTIGRLTLGFLTATSTATSTFAGGVSMASVLSIGTDNALTQGAVSAIIGSSNYIDGTESLIVGRVNTISGVNGRDNLAVGTTNTISGGSTYSFASGNHNTVDGTTDGVVIGNTNEIDSGASDSMAIGNNNLIRAAAYDNVLIGDSNDAAGTGAMFVGYHNISTSAVSAGVLLGLNTKLSADNSLVIGTGLNSANPLENNQANSIYMGTLGVAPTLVMTSAHNVGIGSTTPYTRLSVAGTGVFTALRSTSTLSCDSLDTDATGLIICGTDATGAGGGGSGNVATSTNEVAKQVAVFSSNSATPATIAGYAGFRWDNSLGTLYLTGAASTTGTIEAGGTGGVEMYNMGSGVGTLGFNSLGYSAGVAGYGALFQLAPSTGVFTMFSESNVAAGAAHNHIDTIHWDANGLVTMPIGLVTKALTVNGTATSTFSAGIESPIVSAAVLNATSTTATSTIMGGLNVNGGNIRIATLPNCDTVDTDSSGNFKCGTDATGGGGSAVTEKWATSSVDSLAIYPNAATRIGIGTTSPLAQLTVSATSSLSNLRPFQVTTVPTSGATSTALWVDSRNVVSVGDAVAPQLNAFGTGYYQFQISSSSNDVIAANLWNTSNGANAASAIFFDGDKTPQGGVGAAATYYAGMAYSGSGWNGALNGFAALPANSLVMYATDGRTIVASATSSAAGGVDLIGGAVGFGSGQVDVSLRPSGFLGIASTSPWGLLSVAAPINGTFPAFVVSTSSSAATSSTVFQITSTGSTTVEKLDVHGPVSFTAGSVFPANQSTTTHNAPIQINCDSTCWRALRIVSAGNQGMFIAQTGTGDAFGSDYSGTNAGANAGAFTSDNTLASAVEISGAETGLGTLKITHTGAAGVNASILSLSANSATYLGQGIFMDMLGAADSQKLWNMRSNSIERSTFLASGQLGLSSTSPFAMLSVSATSSLSNIPLFDVSTVLSSTTNSTTTAFIINSKGQVGVGTSTPWGLVSIQATSSVSSTTLPIFVVASSSPQLNTGSSFVNASGTALIVNSNGQVGIATTSPSAPYGLSVQGSLYASATSTFPAVSLNAFSLNGNVYSSLTGTGLTLTNGTLALTSNTIGATSPNSTLTFGSAATLGNTFTGDLNLATANSWTGGQTFVNATSTRMFYGVNAYLSSTSAGNLVSGTLTATSSLTLPFVAGTVCLHSTNGVVTGAASDCGTGTGGGDPNEKWATSTTPAKGIYPNSATHVGIGTTSPGSILTVSATSSLSNIPLFDVMAESQLNATNTAMRILANAQIGISSSSPWALFSINATSSLSNVPLFVVATSSSSGTSSAMVITSVGKVGIGATSSPGFTFAEEGSASIGIGTVASLQTFPGGFTGFAGTSSPWALVSIQATSTQSNIPIFAVASTSANGTTTTLIVDSSGRVGIGTTTPSAPFSLSIMGRTYVTGLTKSGSSQTVNICGSATDGGELIADTVSCLVSSKRFKHDIQTLSVSGLDVVNALRPVTYYDNSIDPTIQHPGLIAEEVVKIAPNMVEIGSDGLPRTVDYQRGIAYLIKAIQELDAKIKNVSVGNIVRSAEENWQWGAMGLLILWNLYLTFRKRK